MTPTQRELKRDNVGSQWAILIMGPSGCGKSTIGKSLASQLGVRFIDADDHHSAQSIDKMNGGTPLTDADREPWLQKLAGLVHSRHGGLVLACSALKERYRRLLEDGPTRLHVAYLQVSEEELLHRLSSRQGHFAGPELLNSQLAALEPPSPDECYDASLDEHLLCHCILDRIGPLALGPCSSEREA